MGINNIIFDFGGVIYDIDFEKSQEAFQQLGVTQKQLSFADPFVQSIFDSLETGKIDSEQFYAHIRQSIGLDLSDNQIERSWNALLIGFVKERIDILRKIRENYNIFLLSNSNIIHYKKYREEFEQQFGYKTFDNLFRKAYFSHEMGLQKPHSRIFETVIQQQKLVPEETLFIDDTVEHVESARKLKIRGYFLDIQNNEDLLLLFNKSGGLNYAALSGKI
ncbi:MAG: HAD family hydrolase [Bacteroidales bacterium]